MERNRNYIIQMVTFHTKKNSDLSKINHLQAKKKLNATQKMKFLSKSVENILRKGKKNTGNQHFVGNNIKHRGKWRQC